MKTKITLMLMIMIFAIGITQVRAIYKKDIIDFSKYEAGIRQQYTNTEKTYLSTKQDGNPIAIVGQEEYMLRNWRVILNKSANSLKNRVLSMCKPVKSKTTFPGKDVLGVRIHFPTWPNNSFALIKPPFPIEIYEGSGKYANVENGVLPNISQIKRIMVWVNGRNYDNQLAVRLRDRDGNIHEYFLGSLYFEGWRKLEWYNPNFTDRVWNINLEKMPLYPKDIPYYVFDSFVVYRQGDKIGGDFVTYIAKLRMEYTPYVVDSDLTNDINDEEIWGIIATNGLIRMRNETEALTEELILFQQERHRLESENR